MYLDRVKARLEELHIVRLNKLVPCTEKEVQALEQKLGRSLPRAYREFLLWMGHETAGLLSGSDYEYEKVLFLQLAAVELLQENHYPDSLPEDAVVFLMHQEYQFLYFRTSEGDDPPVYYFLEGANQPGTITTIHPHFSDFLQAEIEGRLKTIELVARLYPEKIKADPDYARKRIDSEV